MIPFDLSMKINRINIFALAALGEGLSGSDRIFIEFARRWSKKASVSIYVWEEGYLMCQRQNLSSENIKFKVSNMNFWAKLGFLINYFARILESVRLGLTLKIKNDKNTVLYSASDFLMDTFPAFFLKLRYPTVQWIASWYQTAPSPLRGFSEGGRENRYFLSSFIYWLSQLLTRPLVVKSDLILVNNEDERREFPEEDKKRKVGVVLGAVDLNEIATWKKRLKNIPKHYDAVFQGRFHPQKGVQELVDIWKLVVEKKKTAKLVMIGDGPLMNKVRDKIKREGLEKNINLTGYLFDGRKKYEIFSSSKIVLHPAFYDSGGMASAEAMAFGLPAVGFSLKSFQSYYPKGMVKVKIGDLFSFAKNILELLNNESERKKLGMEAMQMIEENWAWDKRAEDVLSKLI